MDMRVTQDHDDIGDGWSRPAIPPNLWELPVDDFPPLLLRPEDAARLLTISRAKVYTLLRLGELRSVKVGASRRISAMALREYVSRLERGAAA